MMVVRQTVECDYVDEGISNEIVRISGRGRDFEREAAMLGREAREREKELKEAKI